MEIDKRSWAVKKTLDRVEIELQWDGEGYVAMRASGHCLLKRNRLWVYRETFGPAQGALSVSDVVCHLAMVVTQDHPTSDESLVLGLRGGVPVEQDPLF